MQKYGTHDKFIFQMIPRTQECEYLSIKSLQLACFAPSCKTSSQETICEADKEYYFHAAKVHLRFRELRARLHSLSQSSNSSPGFFTWFYRPQTPQEIPKPETKLLRRDLKHLEICLRILEQSAIHVLEQNTSKKIKVDLCVRESLESR